MALNPILQGLRIPAFGAPLFILQNPDLVLAQCKAGIPGCFPALNAREKDGEPIELDRWLKRITEELDLYNQANPDSPAAPYAINQIVHRSNVRLERDLEIMVKWKVPIVVTSLGARVELNDAVHSYGGITLHDIINNRFARKAIEKGADGLIAVAAGAGGHAGAISPFALVQEIREWFDGPLLLSGAIATGDALLAAEAMGATRWQVIYKVVLPAAKNGLLGAVLLGVGRGFGETMAVLMATGHAINIPTSVFDSVRALTATIAAELGETAVGSPHYKALFTIGISLFVITFIINLVADLVVRGVRKG